MENYEIHLPSYSIGSAIYGQIGGITRTYGRRAVIVGGHKSLAAAGKLIGAAAEDAGITITGVRWYGGEASYENAHTLLNDEAVQAADMIFAVGGGKALDTGKAAGELSGKPVFTFPTIASTCAATTAVAILYYPDGRFRQPYFLHTPPKHAFINTAVITAAPSRYLWAGMGDTYAKYFESSMSSRGEELVHYHRLGVAVSSMCLEPLLRFGASALADNKAGRLSFPLEQTILAVVVSTGIASILLTADHIIDYNTGLAHAVCYALTSYPQVESNHLHGEVVAFGVLLLLLVDKNEEMFRKIYAFNRSVGLPTSIADIEITPSELEQVIPRVSAMPDIAHNPYPVTEPMVREAFAALERYNRGHPKSEPTEEGFL